MLIILWDIDSFNDLVLATPPSSLCRSTFTSASHERLVSVRNRSLYARLCNMVLPSVHVVFIVHLQTRAFSWSNVIGLAGRNILSFHLRQAVLNRSWAHTRTITVLASNDCSASQSNQS